MPTSVTVPERNYAIGTYEAKMADVGPSATGASITLTRTASINGASGNVAACRVWLSNDNQNWTLLRSLTIPGGVVLGKDGVTPTEQSSFRFEWPGLWTNGARAAQKYGHIKVEVTVLQACRTAISIASMGD